MGGGGAVGERVGPKVGKTDGRVSGNFVCLGAAGGSSTFMYEERF